MVLEKSNGGFHAATLPAATPSRLGHSPDAAAILSAVVSNGCTTAFDRLTLGLSTALTAGNKHQHWSASLPGCGWY